MAASILIDRVKISVLSSGVGAFHLGTAAGGFRGIEALVDGGIYSYSVESGPLYEVGQGTYNAGSTQFIRTPELSSNGNAAVPFPAGVQLVFTARAADLIATGGSLPIANALGNDPNVAIAQQATTIALNAFGMPTGATLVGYGSRSQKAWNDGFSVPLPRGLTTSAAINAFLASVDTSGGRGAVVRIEAGSVFNLDAPIVLPTRMILAGTCPRAAIFNLAYNGPAFVIDSVDYAGLSNLYISLLNNAAAVALDIKTTSASVTGWLAHNLEIAGNSGGLSGQIGLRLTKSGPADRIITEGLLDTVKTFEVDRAVVDTGSEGNTFRSFTFDQFGYGSAKSAVVANSNTNWWQGRIAGSAFAGSTAYENGGFNNQVFLAVDCGSNVRALNIANPSNLVVVSRPYEAGPPVVQSPLGLVAPGTVFIDLGAAYAVPGTPNVVLTGFGSTATVQDVSRNGNLVQFQINSAGTGQTPSPTIDYYYPEGAAPRTSGKFMVSKIGGNTKLADTTTHLVFSDRISWRWDTTPVAGESYIFQVLLEQ